MNMIAVVMMAMVRAVLMIVSQVMPKTLELPCESAVMYIACRC